MNPQHPGDQLLIERMFHLCDKAQSDLVAAHLESCDECRARAEMLRRTLGALETLRETPTPSPLLIARTTQAVRATRSRATFVPFRGLFWSAGALATAALLLIVVAPHFLTGEKDSTPLRMAAAPKQAEAPADRSDTAVPVEEPLLLASASDADAAPAAPPPATEERTVRQEVFTPAPSEPEPAERVIGPPTEERVMVLAMAVPREERSSGGRGHYKARPAPAAALAETGPGEAPLGFVARSRANADDRLVASGADLFDTQPATGWRDAQGFDSANACRLGPDGSVFVRRQAIPGGAPAPWQVTAVNTGETAVVIEYIADFTAPGWELDVSGVNVEVLTNSPRQAMVRFALPPRETRSFRYTLAPTLSAENADATTTGERPIQKE